MMKSPNPFVFSDLRLVAQLPYDPKVVNFFVYYFSVILLFGLRAGPALRKGLLLIRP